MLVPSFYPHVLLIYSVSNQGTLFHGTLIPTAKNTALISYRLNLLAPEYLDKLSYLAMHQSAYYQSFAKGTSRALKGVMTHIKQTGKRTLSLTIATVLVTTLAYGQHHPKLSADLEGRDPETSINVIIQYRHAPEQRNIDSVVTRGGRHLGTLGLVNGAVFSVAAKTLVDLANDPEVELISPD